MKHKLKVRVFSVDPRYLKFTCVTCHTWIDIERGLMQRILTQHDPRLSVAVFGPDWAQCSGESVLCEVCKKRIKMEDHIICLKCYYDL